MSWQRVASLKDVGVDQGLHVEIGDGAIALFRVADKVFALQGICPHAEAYLAEGFVEGDRVECPLHQSQFEITTGRCLGPPADEDLATFPVRVDGEDIFVDLG